MEEEEIKKIREGIQNFLDEHYEEEFNNIIIYEKKDLYIDFFDLAAYDVTLAEQVLDNPQPVINLFNLETKEKLKDRGLVDKCLLPFRVRFYNLPKSTRISISKIRNEHLGKLFTVEGVIKKKSSVISLAISITFACPSCGTTLKVPQDDDTRVIQPHMCSKCARKGNFDLLNKEEIDMFSMVLEEPADLLESSMHPAQLRTLCQGGLARYDLEKRLIQGTRVEITGILKQKQLRDSKTGRPTPRFDWYVDVLSIDPKDETYMDLKWTDEEKKQFHELAANPDWLKILRKSVFYDVHGYDEECEGVLLQMFGGVEKERKGARIRGTINTLLVGDPGCLRRDELVSLPNGSFKRIQDVKGGKILNPVFNNEEKEGVVTDALQFHNERTKIITLDSGKKIGCNYRHPLLVPKHPRVKDVSDLSNYEWMRADELEEGMSVRVVEKIEGDRPDYVNILGEKSKRVVCDEKTGFKTGYHLNLNEKTKVPNHILESKKSVVAAFLRGVYEANGYVFTSKNKGRTKKATVDLRCTKSDRLRQDLLSLMLRFGIRAKATNRGIIIRRQKDVKVFLEEIGFVSKKKQAKAKEALKTLNSLQSLEPKRKDFLHEKIRKIEEGPVQTVYDITVQNYHKYISNGVISHNSSKSTILKIAQKFSPKARYIAGSAVSGAGLIGAVSRDELLGGWQLEAGSLVLATGGMLMIDELDKIDAENKKALHEPLSENSISFSKAGIQATLPAKTSVLAAANPKHGSYSNYDTIYAQIDLSSTLINRFDLVYPIKEDKLKDEDHRSIAYKILRRGRKEEEELIAQHSYDEHFIKKYIAYAKTFEPVLKDEITEFVAKRYESLKIARRQAIESGSTSSTIPITGRNVDSMKRLMEAVARSRFHKEITVEDAEIAYNKIVYSVKQVGIDPDSGLSTGEQRFNHLSQQGPGPITERDLSARINHLLRESKKCLFTEEEIVAVLDSEGLKYSSTMLEKVLSKLHQKGDIMQPRGHRYGYHAVSRQPSSEEFRVKKEMIEKRVNGSEALSQEKLEQKNIKSEEVDEGIEEEDIDDFKN